VHQVGNQYIDTDTYLHKEVNVYYRTLPSGYIPYTFKDCNLIVLLLILYYKN